VSEAKEGRWQGWAALPPPAREKGTRASEARSLTWWVVGRNSERGPAEKPIIF
jgi:hypothetical protein